MEPFGQTPVWTEQLRMCSYDVDFTHRATLASLCRYFLEAAWNHAESLGIGFEILAKDSKFWVLSRMVLQVEEYPQWRSGAVLKTWPRGIKSVFAMRDFELETEAGKRIAAGSSAWLILDAATKRPQRLHKLMPNLAAMDGRSALERDPEKLEDCSGWEKALPTRVRYTDIDVNRHVGSSRYVGWLLDSYPMEYFRTHSVRHLEINYLGETLEGDELTVHTLQSGPETFVHSLTRDDGDEVCRARLEFRELPSSS